MSVSRDEYIAGLRALAGLLEEIPAIPHYDYGSISFAIGGSDDEAFAAIDAAAAALNDAGVPFERHGAAGNVSVDIVLAGVRYAFSRITEERAAENDARRSYERNIRVDTDAAAHRSGGGQ